MPKLPLVLIALIVLLVIANVAQAGVYCGNGFVALDSIYDQRYVVPLDLIFVVEYVDHHGHAHIFLGDGTNRYIDFPDEDYRAVENCLIGKTGY